MAASFRRGCKKGWQASYFGDDMLPLAGGVPLKDASGAIVGAIGISGLAAHEDHAIADAVAAKLSAR